MRQGRVLWCIKGRLSWQGLQLPYVPKGSLSLCQLAGVNSWRAWVACWDCWTRPCVHTRIIDIIDCVTLGYSEVQVLLRVHRWHALWGQRKLQGSAIVGQQSVWHDMTKHFHCICHLQVAGLASGSFTIDELPQEDATLVLVDHSENRGQDEDVGSDFFFSMAQLTKAARC